MFFLIYFVVGSQMSSSQQKENAALLLLTFSRESRVEGRFSVAGHLPITRRSIKRKHSDMIALPLLKPGNILAPEKPEKPVKKIEVFQFVKPEAKSKSKPKLRSKLEHTFLPKETILGCRYKIVDTRGFGGFGCVYVCMDINTKQMVAVKVFKNSELFQLSARNEVYSLTLLKKTEGVIQMLDHFDHGNQACIVMELCDTSLLYRLTTQFKTGFSLTQVRKYAKQILQATSVLHSKGIVHSDIKPDNLGLLDDNVKLLDLGSCKLASKPYLYAQTLRYRAPEVLMGLPSSNKIDMWAIGCTFFELYTGKCLFRSDFLSVDEKQKNLDQLIKITKTLGPLPSAMLEKSNVILPSLSDTGFSGTDKPLQIDDPTFQKLILGLLAYDPSLRLTSKQALDHPFFVSLL
jgi:dual-specificity kinase